jgi:hypothetical protein
MMFMDTARLLMEKLLFPGWAHAQRRRHMRFLMLAIFLGVFLAAAFGICLYMLNSQGRM